MFKTQIAAAALSLALTTGLFAGSAHAQESRKITVSYNDLNLATEHGQKVLQRRLETAARMVCDYDQTVTGSILRSRGSVACYKQARERASDQMAVILDDTRLGG